MSSVSAPSEAFDEFKEETEEGPQIPYLNNHKNKSDILRRVEEAAIADIS